MAKIKELENFKKNMHKNDETSKLWNVKNYEKPVIPLENQTSCFCDAIKQNTESTFAI